MSSVREFPMQVNPAPDLTRLAAFLCTAGYSLQARYDILEYAHRVGTLEGLEAMGALEPADRAEADAHLESAWPEESDPWTNPAWDGEDEWTIREEVV